MFLLFSIRYCTRRSSKISYMCDLKKCKDLLDSITHMNLYVSIKKKNRLHYRERLLYAMLLMFLLFCIECEAPIIDGIGQCDLHDDLCEASCPLGYILPRGQQKQTFQCGQSTNFTWNPFQRLPICSRKSHSTLFQLQLSL